MKIVNFHLLVLCFVPNLLGQSIQELFEHLPLKYTPELTMNGKDSLLQYGVYTIPGGDSLETMEISILDQTDDYLRLNYYFTTSQRAFTIVELRKFTKQDKSLIVLYSKFGGFQRAFDQDKLLAFDIVGNSFVQNISLNLPVTVEAKQFLKPNIPTSLLFNLNSLSTSYNLMSNYFNSIEYVVEPQTKEFDEWIHSTTIVYTWNGDRFERKE